MKKNIIIPACSQICRFISIFDLKLTYYNAVYPCIQRTLLQNFYRKFQTQTGRLMIFIQKLSNVVLFMNLIGKRVCIP